MNLAFHKTPTIGGTWDETPSPLKMLTDEDVNTPITSRGARDGTNTVYFQIDLGDVYEVYEIKIYSGYGGGYKSHPANAGHIYLKTHVIPQEFSATTRDTQTTTSPNYIPITLHYEGEGIPVRYVYLSMKGDGAYTQYIQPAEIEVFGC